VSAINAAVNEGDEVHLRKRRVAENDDARSIADQDKKIAQCFGDCDSDSYCEEGLICYHRDIDDEDDQLPVPGCSALENPEINTTNSVCVRPEQIPVHAVGRTAPVRRNLLNLCRGDCDSDADCASNLVCEQRDRGDPVSGCPSKNLNTNRDYCVQPTTPSNRNNGNEDNNENDGLGLCQGDCDGDSDCEEGLVCYQREPYDPIPSGCRGSLSWRTDYCVRPNSNNNNIRGAGTSNGNEPNNADATTSTAPFRLKLYWEEGYYWQEEDFERKCKYQCCFVVIQSLFF